MKVGKSTVAEMLSKRLNLPHIRLDLLRWDYFNKMGWTEDKLQKNRDELSELGFMEFCSSLELPMLSMIFDDYHNCIFDFGGGNAMYSEPNEVQQVKDLINNFPNSFLILPSADLAESMLTINRRNSEYKGRGRHFTLSELKVNSDILKYHYEHPIASHTIYNLHMSAHDVAEKIISLMDTKSQS